MEVKAGTHNHVKTKRLKRLLGIPLYQAVGILETLWLLCADCCDEGDIGKFTDEEIADYLEWDCSDSFVLVQALTNSGWLDASNEHRLVIHDWLDHCPQYIKDRLRMRESRESKASKSRTYASSNPNNDEQNRTDTEHAGECHVSSKAGQGNSIPTQPIKGNASLQVDSLFERFWVAFPRGRKGSKELARKAWAYATKKADPETIIGAATEYASSPVGQSEFVKGPAPWLNQGCWEDDREAWQDKKAGKKPRTGITLLEVTDGSDHEAG